MLLMRHENATFFFRQQLRIHSDGIHKPRKMKLMDFARHSLKPRSVFQSLYNPVIDKHAKKSNAPWIVMLK